MAIKLYLDLIKCFTKINKVNLIDYTLKEILNSEINKIIVIHLMKI